MDDAEAEAVLLALGPQLEWTQPHEHGEHIRGFYQSRQLFWLYRLKSREEATYIIMYRASGENDFMKRYVNDSPHVWRTGNIPAAKAACERYHATGKWE